MRSTIDLNEWQLPSPLLTMMRGGSGADAVTAVIFFVLQAWRTMNCLTVVTVFSLIRKASDQVEGCSGPTRYLLMVTDLSFSQKDENPVF